MTGSSVRQGQVIHVPVGVRHAVAADRGSPVVSVGGPCPADLAMLRPWARCRRRAEAGGAPEALPSLHVTV